jgi:hypothetical protein
MEKRTQSNQLVAGEFPWRRNREIFHPNREKNSRILEITGKSPARSDHF